MSIKKISFFMLFGLFLVLGSINIVFSEDKFTLLSPNYFDEQENIYDEIHYLEDEYLSFSFCSDEKVTDLEVKLTCLGEVIEIPYSIDDREDGCYYANYNLNSLSCDSFILDVDYKANNVEKAITRNFQKQKESLLINHILGQDYLTLSPLELSYYLIVLSEVKGIDNKDVQDAYDHLKNLRNNNLKCWPASSCSMSQTSDILRNIKLAGFPEDSRVLEDGKFYLEGNIIDRVEGDYEINEFENYNFELKLKNNFNSSGDIRCDLEVDNGDEIRYTFDDGDDRDNLMVDDSIDDRVVFDCDETIDEVELRIYEKKLHEEEYSSDDAFDFDLTNDEKNTYDNFDFVMEFVHDFSPGEEIECTLTTDGNDDNFILDENSDENDLVISRDFDDRVELDCDDDLDDIYLDIYANLDNVETYTNQDLIEYDLDSFNNGKRYEFRFDLDYTFSSYEELECTLKTDDSTRNYVFDENDEDNLVIDQRSVADTVELNCDKDLEFIRFKLYDSFGRAQIDETKENENSYKNSVPKDFDEYSCIGKKDTCDYITTVQALYTYGNKLNNYDGIEKYVSSMIQDQGIKGTYINDKDSITDTSRYLLYKKNDDLTEYIKFVQNNEGSWGSNDKITSTSLAILGLENSDSDSEHLEDGKDWVYYSEPLSGWGSVEKNGVAYVAIKEKLKPYLDMNVNNVINNTYTFVLENPTIYQLKDVKIEFSEELGPYLSYLENLGNLAGEEEIVFNVSLTDGFYGYATGNMMVTGVDNKDNEITLLDIPISIQGPMLFELDGNKFSISEDFPDVDFDVVNMASNFTSVECDYENPFTNTKENVVINQATEQVVLSNPSMKTGNYDVDFECLVDDNSFAITKNVNIGLANVTFKTSPKPVVLTSYEDDFNIVVNSLVKGKQVLEMKIDGDYVDYISVAESEKIIGPEDTRDIFFAIDNPTLLETMASEGEGSIIISSNLGYTEVIPITFDIPVQQEKESSNLHWYIGIAILTLIVVSFVLYRYKQYKEQEEAEQQQNQQNGEDEIYMDDDLDFK